MNYQEIYQESINDPESFWKKQAEKLNWYKQPSRILGIDEYDYPQWFQDGKLNLSYLCIDKHIEDGFGNQNAIIYDSPVTDKKQCVIHDNDTLGIVCYVSLC